MTVLPNALRLLLETPLEEELYQDWVYLLETVLISFAPLPTHLLICMTIMAHEDFDNDTDVRSSCHRVLLKTLASYGPRAFKDVLNFNSDDLGRHKRRKVRKSGGDLENEADDNEHVDCRLSSTESLCVRFDSIWEFFRHALSETYESTASYGTLQLSTFLCQLLEEDWCKVETAKNDMTKTLLVQCMRARDEKKVDLKNILSCLLSFPKLSSRGNITTTDGLAYEESFVPECTMEMLNARHRLLALIFRVPKVNRLNIILETELQSTLANLVAPLRLADTIGLLTLDTEDSTPEFYKGLPSLCNALLFRLAAYPGKHPRAGDRTIDWAKVQGWCASTSRGSDPVEAVKVELFKYILFMTFTTDREHNLRLDEILVLGQKMMKDLASMESLIPDPTLTPHNSTPRLDPDLLGSPVEVKALAEHLSLSLEVHLQALRS